MKKLALALILVSSIILGQYVDEIVLNKTVNTDGIHIEPDGIIYSTEAWNGNKIFKISQAGIVETFATGLKGPIDIVKGIDGNFYVSEWTGSSIAKVTPEGTVSKFASIKPGPGPMTIDSDGNIFVTHNINNGSGYITKITPSAEVSIFASGSPLVNPGGIDIDEFGNFYVANFNDGKIIKIDQGLNKTVVATVPGSGTWKTGHLKYINGFIFISAIEDHRIYRLDTSGNLEVYAGTGIQGRVNGGLNNAQFNNPNGLGKFHDGSILYVTASFGPTNYIQRINFNGTTSIKEKSSEFGYLLEQNYPNPFNPSTTISYRLKSPGHVSLVVYDMKGELISELINEYQSAGQYEKLFDAKTFGLSSGVYLFRIEVKNENYIPLFTEMRKSILLK